MTHIIKLNTLSPLYGILSEYDFCLNLLFWGSEIPITLYVICTIQRERLASFCLLEANVYYVSNVYIT